MTPPVKNFSFLKYPYGDCTQYFGENHSLYAFLGLAGHNGIDIVRPWGEHMFAVEDGTIAQVKSTEDGYGAHIRLISKADENGKLREWTYGHMSFIAVKEGDKVKEGQYVGNIGNTGFVVSGETANGFWKENPYSGTHDHCGLRLMRHDKEGWKYPGYSRAITCLNYNNGFKGAIDPVPYLVNAKSKAYKYAMLADKTNNKLYWQVASLLLKLKL